MTWFPEPPEENRPDARFDTLSAHPRTALVLRHDPAIGLGNLGPTLEAHGYEIVTVDAPSTDVSGLDALAPDLVIVLGGDEAAYETDRYPYLADEIELLRTRIDAEAPIFGVCLGAQLLAKTLGARAYKGERTEVGWLTVEPTAAGADSPVRHFAGVPTVQWHGDTFELPEGVERLAGSAQYDNQAFAKGDWLLAVQFHPEVDDAIHEDWLAAWGDELPEYGLSREQLRAQLLAVQFHPEVDDAIHEDWLAAWGDELPEYGLSREQLRAQRAEYGRPMQEASARLLGEYLDGLGARIALAS